VPGCADVQKELAACYTEEWHKNNETYDQQKQARLIDAALNISAASAAPGTPTGAAGGGGMTSRDMQALLRNIGHVHAELNNIAVSLRSMANVVAGGSREKVRKALTHLLNTSPGASESGMNTPIQCKR
jgi:hypothetical protein